MRGDDASSALTWPHLRVLIYDPILLSAKSGKKQDHSKRLTMKILVGSIKGVPAPMLKIIRVLGV